MRAKPVKNILPTIADVDLEPIAVTACLTYGMNRTTAERGIQELKRFYTLCSLYPKERFAPSIAIGKMWHLHILDTVYYPEDCAAMFGRMLHHDPYLGITPEAKRDLESAFVQTKLRYREAFGEELRGLTAGAAVFGSDDGCGSGDISIIEFDKRPRFKDLPEYAHA